MNATAIIAKDTLLTEFMGKELVNISAGQTYSGTVTRKGLFIFHVTHTNGRIVEVRAKTDADFLKIKTFVE